MNAAALASTLAAAPDAAAMLRPFVPRADSLVVEAVVDAFVRRAAETSTDAGRARFSEWLRGVCTAYGDIPELRTTLLALPEALARAGAAGGAALPAPELEAFSAAVSATVQEWWRPLRRIDAQPIDEVDARIDAFIVQLELRDPMTSEHSRAVGSWCRRLARRLGLDAQEETFAARCGILHDVGKIKTPLAVLNAPRALTAPEWKMMRAHAAAGEAMVRAVPELRAFAPAVRSHHERLDGKGYPDGLPSSAIPLMARIVAVADCFNAMIGRRPYRLPLEPMLALEELFRHRGTQFDPEIVDAMADVISA
ncbi:MAG TPA: HD domain-containing phosphohydrolase [Candidatus Baltobacteraceae bacterium]|nr:HD domain-containing phosphohydrolase [Candidatus Baltobacteraceae bacterium]